MLKKIFLTESILKTIEIDKRIILKRFLNDIDLFDEYF